jgi:alpha-beta hydrolase superfamily lysophospholipase
MTVFDMPTNSSIASRHGIARPLYFESDGDQLFAWLHLPTEYAASNLGVIICAPFGYESICAHRSIREFAESITDTGIPAMRFDYLGTGDSADAPDGADHIQRWAQDIVAAIGELKRLTRVERICLLGIRLGGLLATLAAAQCGNVDSLILIGTVVSGRRYVRELRTAQLAGIALSGIAPVEGDSDTNPSSSHSLEAGGFSLSAATLASLALVDLQAAAAPPVRSILILDSDKLPSAKRWCESLFHSGVELEYRTLPGLIEMVMTAPQFAAVPRAMIDATCDWLTVTAMSNVAERKADSFPGNQWVAPYESSLPATLTLVENLPSPRSPITERPVFISSSAKLFAIVTEPASDEKRRRAVILLNPGADFHIGASRMYVSLARRWARRGYFVVRLDFAGIGDSATRTDKVDDEVFPDEAIDDIRNTVEFIQSQYAIHDVTLAGLCSGAYHALRAAAAGLNVNRILMVNPQNYFWKKGMTLGQIQLVEVVHNPGLYRQRVWSPRAWLRVFKGDVNVMRIAAIYLQRLRLAGETMLREIARSLRIRLPNDLGWDLERIVASGIRITLVFARGEPGIELLKLQAGATLSRLGDRFRLRLIDGGDHIFSRRASRFLMENVLSEELYARADGVGETPVSHTPTALHQTSTE